MSQKTLLVTGAAGFIGSTFVRIAQKQGYKVLILDKLTYAGHIENISELLNFSSCQLIEGDIQNFTLVDSIFAENDLDGVIHFAAESHVDNSITGPKAFIETNILGTFNLLEVARKHWTNWSQQKKAAFRFVHVSTDEVFGQLGAEGKFSEKTPYAPNSPYSSSKAASDLLVRAWFHTYGMPLITTNCSNNYGPRQFPEKLIPKMIMNALGGLNLPVYGQGQNIRDWIHVEDHSAGVLLAFEKGTPGEVYCFGGNSERNNLEVVHRICEILDEVRPLQNNQSYKKQIQFVEDRAGHDYRYAIDDTFAQKTLGFTRKYNSFEDGLKETINWYLANQPWIESVTKKSK